MARPSERRSGNRAGSVTRQGRRVNRNAERVSSFGRSLVNNKMLRGFRRLTAFAAICDTFMLPRSLGRGSSPVYGWPPRTEFVASIRLASIFRQTYRRSPQPPTDLADPATEAQKVGV